MHDDDEHEEQPRRTRARGLGPLIQAGGFLLTIGAIVWTASTRQAQTDVWVTVLQRDLARIEQKVNSIEASLGVVPVMRQRIDDHEIRLSRLEERRR